MAVVTQPSAHAHHSHARRAISTRTSLTAYARYNPVTSHIHIRHIQHDVCRLQHYMDVKCAAHAHSQTAHAFYNVTGIMHTGHIQHQREINAQHSCISTAAGDTSATLTRHAHGTYNTCMVCARHMRGTCTAYATVCTVYARARSAHPWKAQAQHTCARFPEISTVQAFVLVPLTLVIH